MRYTDSMERSAEHLRAALAQMTRQRAALHPTSYAVWYEYVSGRNPDLRHAMNTLLADGGTLDESQTWELYSRHLGEWDSTSARRISDGFQRVLNGISASAAHAGDHTARFGVELSELSQKLEGDTAPAETVREILSGVRELSGVMNSLQQRLDASRNEIAELRREVELARNEALVDALTGLANRRAFDQELAQAIRSGDQLQPPCLMLGDIDFFKRLNDTYGHAFGDQVLRGVAQTLKGMTAAPALAARVGGEEFAVLMPSCSLNQAHTLAEQLRHNIAAGRIRRGAATQDDERVTLSFGVTQLAVGESANDFFDRADRALYASKRSGRNCVTVLAARAA
ncbi:GGDEF domain-containing protein [Pelomonas sp. SE-A7]|uniref:GGDEF domain-containing protein n=1 Tax=Pelomonas sp. SE-A7 TaxID=3054953 RepID=UPI00259CB7D4|nr:GGDEF domain-containing protein [Pelomonas sp. SE-A7]MDM4765634.1 GGDEF domain-containing protein [Pelomonas sp. SE-A7]